MNTFEVRDPATGSTIDTVPNLGAEDAERAVVRAEAAFPAFHGLGAAERAGRLWDFHGRIVAALPALALLIVAESGKPMREAEAEVRYAADFVRFYAEEAPRAFGRTHPRSGGQHTRMTVMRPVGVAAAITPWNFPAAMVTRKIAPAFAAGCPVVLKPSELTPLTARMLHQLADEAGLGGDVFQVITTLDAAAVGHVFCRHPGVAKLSFTGSTGVGKRLYADAAGTMLRLSLELGGNAPLIVMDDADIAVAIKVTMAAKFRNAGQTCIAANRILVQEGIAGTYLEALRAAVAGLKTGDGRDPSTDIGPMITDGARARVKALVDGALAHGAKISAEGSGCEDGNFLKPILVEGVSPHDPLVAGEIFGPIAAVMTFATMDEAIHLANATRSGLAAYAVTQSLDRTLALSERLDAGIIGINSGAVSAAEMPFGGLRESGLGREGAAEGLAAYMETRYWCWESGTTPT